MAEADQRELALDLLRAFRPEERAEGLARGICRLFDAMGYTPLCEAPLGSGRRADVLALSAAGRFAIVEIKSGLADFRSDQKWQDYLAHCDRFYFGVVCDFPREALPEEVGLIIADRFGAALVREARLVPMGAGLRRRQAIRFGRIAANRLRFLYAEPG
jgi:hypothetical protein